MKLIKKSGRVHIFLLVSAVLLYSFHADSADVDESGPIYYSWDVFEVDKCASIWLIKRFIHKDAVIRIVPKGQFLKEGVPFDIPGAPHRRYYNMSTFESILKASDLRDPKLAYIAKIIHDIEINIWEKKLMKETWKVQHDLNAMIENSDNHAEIIQNSVQYFNALYKAVEFEK